MAYTEQVLPPLICDPSGKMGTSEHQLFKLSGLETRFLDVDDLPFLQIFLQNCADYYTLVTGLPPNPASAHELITGLPEGKSEEDKFVIGIFRNPEKMKEPIYHFWQNLGFQIVETRPPGKYRDREQTVHIMTSVVGGMRKQ